CLGLEFRPDLAAPRAIFAYFVPPIRSLYRRDVLPRLVIASPVHMMKRVEDTQPGPACRCEHFLHVQDAVVGLCDLFHTIPYESALGDEVVVRVNDQEARDLLVKGELSHCSSDRPRTKALCCVK